MKPVEIVKEKTAGRGGSVAQVHPSNEAILKKRGVSSVILSPLLPRISNSRNNIHKEASSLDSRDSLVMKNDCSREKVAGHG